MKRKAIIVDIDGNLALRKEGPGERGPFDWKRVGEDLINEQVKLAVELFRRYGHFVILKSGRPEGQKEGGTEVREETNAWLARNGVIWDMFLMRDAGDFVTPDDVVKERLYRKWVEPYFDVDVVLDDRKRVVDMWRRIGLQCWQTAPGDFG